jgi:hypothetical protein
MAYEDNSADLRYGDSRTHEEKAAEYLNPEGAAQKESEGEMGDVSHSG